MEKIGGRNEINGKISRSDVEEITAF